MIHTFHIDDSDSKAKALLEFIKTLDFVSVEENNNIPAWQQKEVLQNLQEIKEGKAELIDWDTTKQDLYKRYNIK